MDQGAVNSLSQEPRLSQLPAQQVGEASGQKKVFGRRVSLVPPTEACSFDLVRHRAYSSFGFAAVKACTLATVSPLFASPERLTPYQRKFMKKAEECLEGDGVTQAIWERRWQELQDISSGLNSLVEANKGVSGEDMISAIRKNEDLNAALVDLVDRERNGEVDAQLQAMIIDSRLTGYLGLAEYVKPGFDWRCVRSQVKEEVWHPSEKRKRQGSERARVEKKPRTEECLGQMPARYSLQGVIDRAGAHGFPEVAYAPARFYARGCILFPVREQDRRAVDGFGLALIQQLQEVEWRLAESGMTPGLFAAHWAFLCDYSVMLETPKKQLEEDLEGWLAYVMASENDGNDSGILLSLMLDYLTVTVELQPEKNKSLYWDKPTLNWRQLCSSARPLSRQEILDNFDFTTEPDDKVSDPVEASAPASVKRRKDDLPDKKNKFKNIEGTWQYELERAKQLQALQRKQKEEAERKQGKPEGGR